MNRYILTLILSLVTLCSYGQSGRLIYGCVYGEKKTPLQGAKITTPHGDLICTTDQNGQFNAQSSTYIKEIVVLHDDYQAKYVKVDGSYLIIKMRVAIQTSPKTTDDTNDAEEVEQTTNLIAEHKAHIANERRAAAEEAAKIRAEEIARLDAERVAAKAEAQKRQEMRKIAAEEAAKIRAEEIARLDAERAAAKAEAQKRQEMRKSEIATINEEIAGWQNSVYVNVSSCDDYEPGVISPSIGIEYVGGKRFNNAFFLGFGTGVVLNTHNQSAAYWDDWTLATPLCLPLNRVSIPLYVNVKLYLSRTRCQPYISLSSGLRFSGKRLFEFSTKELLTYNYDPSYYNNQHSIKYGTNQYFITPGLGLDYRFKSGTTLSLQAAFHAITMPVINDPYFVGAKQVGLMVNHKMRPGYHVQIGITF